jgi:23S rRNA pseudouridine2457 synthase
LKKEKPFTYVVFNKPYGVLSQFTDEAGRSTLKDFIPIPRIYPVGRLDMDSEGLLLLTNDGLFNQWLTNPKNHQEKTYLVQVEGVPTEEQLLMLKKGIVIESKKTLPAHVRIIPEPKLWERTKPIRFRKNIPTTWLEMSIREGMNRQIRKMTAAVKLPCLRLVRVSIGPIMIGPLKPGKYAFIKMPHF